MYEFEVLCAGNMSLLDWSSDRCVVYSIGSNNQWDFEEAIFRSTKCMIETFDCTLVSKREAFAIHIGSKERHTN